MKIINNKKFTKAALDKNIKAFVIYMIFFSLNSMTIHTDQKAQIALLVIKEAHILLKHSDFLDIFIKKKA